MGNGRPTDGHYRADGRTRKKEEAIRPGRRRGVLGLALGSAGVAHADLLAAWLFEFRAPYRCGSCSARWTACRVSSVALARLSFVLMFSR
jgi:chorismate synthase